MGFTVIGARTFLGSGHPAEGSGGHANRGLIESTDSGKTWKASPPPRTACTNPATAGKKITERLPVTTARALID
ncbi:hypothetical protein ACIPPR_36225 [Streptomyces nigra]|uniref:hypothetical protein n=1 Tax=Streptomyces nigra TaxID=1827580 RepID=UPI003816BB42